METNRTNTPETVPGMLAENSATCPERPFLINADLQLSHAEIDARSRQLAKALLASNVSKGTRVGLLYPNGVEFVVAFLAITRIGAVACPFNTFLKPPELAYQLRHSDVLILLTAADYLRNNYVSTLETAFPELESSSESLSLEGAPFLRQIVVTAPTVPGWAVDIESFLNRGSAFPDSLVSAAEQSTTAADWLCILYTSGSMAEPKAVVHSQGGFLRRQKAIANMSGYRPGDVIYGPMPWFWLGGLSQLICSFVSSASMVFEERFNPPGTLALMESAKVTHVTAWPHYAAEMRADPSFADRDLSSLRGGSIYELMMDPERNPAHYAGGIGMTETAGQHCEGVDEKLPESLYGATGKLFDDLDHRIVDPQSGQIQKEGEIGELQVRGYSVLQTYYKREREDVFEHDGFFATGDLGYIRDGFYFYTGRLGDMIKASGANVSPRQVEAELQNIAGVKACYVTGIDNPEKDQLVAAAIIPETSAQLTVEEIIAELKPRLSAFKLPKVIKFIDDFPMLATGKLDKRRLAELLSASE